MKIAFKNSTALGLVMVAGILTLPAAHAMNSPQGIAIDGGPLGQLTLSGGVDGYGYYASNTSNGQLSHGMNVANAMVELQESSGILQFTIEVGSSQAPLTVGALSYGSDGHLLQTSISNFSTGPLYAGYLTIAPKNMPFTVSAGRLSSLEGYEAGIDWFNPSQLTTSLFDVQNNQADGVLGTYTAGSVTLSIEFGDGWDTHVFNFLQLSGNYIFNASNSLYVYYAGNLGRTGLNAYTYALNSGWGPSGLTVGNYGPYFINSQMFGGYYSYTHGNLNLVPEVQYVYAKPDHELGINKFTSNFGAALFSTYSFTNTPYSVGGWVEYEKSVGAGNWFVGPKSEAIGFAVSPTWQYKDLFARANAGGLYLLDNRSNGGSTYGYGNNGRGKFQFVSTLEAGVLF